MLRRSHFCKASLLIPIIQVRGIRRTQEGSSSRASDRTCELQQFLQFLQSLRFSSPHMGHMKNLCRARVERNMLFKKRGFFSPRPQNKLNLCNQGPKGKKKKKREEERKSNKPQLLPLGGQNWNNFVFWVTICTHDPKALFQGAHNKAVLIAGSKNNSVLHTAHSSGQSSCSSQH